MLTQAPGHEMLPPITPSRYQYTAQPMVIRTHQNQQLQSAQGASNITASTSLGVWLECLDQMPSRQHPDIAYTSFIQIFVDQDIRTVGELLSLGFDGLTKIAGIKVGTARRLFDWANEDI